MIVFDLMCVCGFVFEGWFQDREDFTSQQHADLLACPECGSRDVRKIVSPVHLNCSDEKSEKMLPISNEKNLPEDTEEKSLRSLQEYVKKNFEDVGVYLAEESLKIHYGVEKPRNIRGVATEEEEKVLKKEGIHLIKIPMPAKDEDVN